jgi:hypothetical protein
VPGYTPPLSDTISGKPDLIMDLFHRFSLLLQLLYHAFFINTGTRLAIGD